jgi:hypothetical protein
VNRDSTEAPDPSAATHPSPWFGPLSGGWRRGGRWAFLLLVCGYFSLSYASLPDFLHLPLYTQGAERLPYQYRVLPMFVFRLLTRFQPLMRAGSHVHALADDPYRLILAIIAFLGLLGAVLATAATLRQLTQDRVFSFWASLLVVWMAQIDLAYAWDNPFTAPYDVLSVMFFAVAMFLVLRRHWWLYYPVFVLAVLNRETACFITVFFVIWETIRLRSAGEAIQTRVLRIAPHVLLQLVMWVAIKVMLARHFAGNPVDGLTYGSGLFVTHFGYNLRELVNPGQWPMLLSLAGFSIPFVWLQRRWLCCPGLAWSIGIILPLTFAAMMIVGVIVEIRIFADWIALLAPAVALIVYHRFRPVAA